MLLKYQRFICSFSAALLAISSFSTSANADKWSEILPADSQIEKIAGGFAFTEGPAWHPDGFLVFSDIPNERVIKYDSSGKLTDFFTPSGQCNGLICDEQGFVYACQGGKGQMLKLNADGSLNKVLVSKYDGKLLNSPNDVALDAVGGLYFTDPAYGPKRELPQPMMAVYYVNSKGKVTRVIDDLKRPNGVNVSPDGKSLYVAEPNLGQVYRYKILSPGKLGSGKLIFQGNKELDGAGGPDGMVHDVQGNLYATYKGIVVLNPEGKVLGRIKTPEHPANCTFGDADNKTLYITARTGLYKIRLNIPGMGLQKKGPDLAQAAQPKQKRTLQLQTVAIKETKTTDVNLRGLKLQIPESWNAQKPSNRLRLAQYEVPAAEGVKGSTEFVVFPPFGGSIDDNLGRWINQFDTTGGKLTTIQGKSAQGAYYLLDISGTYKKPDGPPFLRKTIDAPGHRMLAIILSVPEKGNFFLKMVGPEKTVAAEIEAFRNSFSAKADSEKEYEMKN